MKFAFVPFLYMAMTDPQQQQQPSNQRAATLRPFTMPDTSRPRNRSLQSRTDDMNQLAKAGAPLSTDELNDVLNSFQNVYPADASSNKIDFEALKRTLLEVAHVSHKDWTVTEENAQLLKSTVLKDGIHGSAAARQWLERILVEGNWDGAVEHTTTSSSDSQPWAVLVTGVNGIRKTTSLYQDWWPQLLQEALVAPPVPAEEENGTKRKDPPLDLPLESLPSGSNSFFRQLDHMIATLCNEDFKALYVLTQQELNGEEPSPSLVSKYSNLKAAIFTRYRTLSELLGALLLKEAQTLQSNCMMETSGRDVAMFHYVDHMFDDCGQYRKLALHFTINDLSHAKTSVDRRMVQEIEAGISAVAAQDDVQIIHANAGGPYGSDVLEGVQEASDAVWNNVVLKGGSVGKDWYKATIAIRAYDDKPWTAQAVKPDGSLGTVFTFVQKK